MLKRVLRFILAHLPLFLRWSSEHIDDVVEDCPVCDDGSHPICGDCPFDIPASCRVNPEVCNFHVERLNKIEES